VGIRQEQVNEKFTRRSKRSGEENNCFNSLWLFPLDLFDLLVKTPGFQDNREKQINEKFTKRSKRSKEENHRFNSLWLFLLNLFDLLVQNPHRLK